MKGIEPPTPSLPWKCSTPELHWPQTSYGCGQIPKGTSWMRSPENGLAFRLTASISLSFSKKATFFL